MQMCLMASHEHALQTIFGGLVSGCINDDVSPHFFHQFKVDIEQVLSNVK